MKKIGAFFICYFILFTLVAAAAPDLSNCRSLILIDFSMLSCYACMDQFNHFSDYIKGLKQKADLTGILVIEDPGSLSITNLKKLLKGFILGNNIEYPINLDLRFQANL